MRLSDYSWVVPWILGAIAAVLASLSALSQFTGYTIKDWLEHRRARRAKEASSSTLPDRPSDGPAAHRLPGPEPPSYRDDLFYDIRWRWSWSPDGDGFRPVSLRPHCPDCGTEMGPVNPYGQSIESYSLRACACRARWCNKFIPLPSSFDDIESTVYKFIERNQRSGQRGEPRPSTAPQAPPSDSSVE